MKLNLGSSDNLLPDFLSVDIWTPPGARLWEGDENWAGAFMQADLRKPLKLPDSSCDEIRAHDILEHLPSKIKSMNECHRLLKPGGLLDLFIPTTDGRGAFQDPTHVTYWTPNDMFYYCEYFAEWIRFHETYGISAQFRVQGASNATEALMLIERGHREWLGKVWKLKIALEAVK